MILEGRRETLYFFCAIFFFWRSFKSYEFLEIALIFFNLSRMLYYTVM